MRPCRCSRRRWPACATCAWSWPAWPPRARSRSTTQLAGAESADPSTKYLLFLDDDIQCHPGTIGVLVDSLEERPEVFVATGYSFDVPSTNSPGRLRRHVLPPAAAGGDVGGGPCFFVWGGCIMIRAGDLRANRHGMHTALKKNGYSNDLILTSVAGQHNARVVPHGGAVPGPHVGRLDHDALLELRAAPRSLRSSPTPTASRTAPTGTGWVAYSYLAFALTLPLLPSVLHVAHSLGLLGYQAVAPVLGAADPLGVGAAAAGGLSTLVPRLSLCPIGLGLSWFNVLALGFSTLMCVRLFFAAITLCNLLSPEKKPIEISKLSLGLGVGGHAGQPGHGAHHRCLHALQGRHHVGGHPLRAPPRHRGQRWSTPRSCTRSGTGGQEEAPTEGEGAEEAVVGEGAAGRGRGWDRAAGDGVPGGARGRGARPSWRRRRSGPTGWQPWTSCSS